MFDDDTKDLENVIERCSLKNAWRRGKITKDEYLEFKRNGYPDNQIIEIKE